MENKNLLDLNMSISTDEKSGEERYIIFNLAESTFAVNCKYVVSIEKPTKITEMASPARGVRGVGYYKDEAINIFDLRVIFGYPSHEYHVEHEINIGGHLAQHKTWADEIKAKVKDGTDFDAGFTSDPFKCDLGQWFESYKTDNAGIQNFIKRILPFHEKFHKLSDKAANFRSENKDDIDRFIADANEIAEELERNLQELHDALIKQAKELTIVLRINGKKIGIIIDDAESVETLHEIQVLPPAALATDYITKLGFRRKAWETMKQPPPTLILEAQMFA